MENKLILILHGGYTLHSEGGSHRLGASIWFCDQYGQELVHWTAQQFADDPEQAMAAFLSLLLDSSLLERYRRLGEKTIFLIPDQDKENSDEVVIYTLEDAYVLCSGGEIYPVGAYLRFCLKGDLGEDGEIVYWDQVEWQERTEEVLGAVLACLQRPSLLGRHMRKKQEHRRLLAKVKEHTYERANH
jgi:hypothetical protein